MGRRLNQVGRGTVLFFLPTSPSCQSWTPEGLLKSTLCPSGAPELGLGLLAELQLYIKARLWGPRTPLHTLILSLYKKHSLITILYWKVFKRILRFELVTRPGLNEAHQSTRLPLIWNGGSTSSKPLTPGYHSYATTPNTWTGTPIMISLASQSIGQSLVVTLYLYQLWRHIYTNDDVRAIGQSIGTQLCCFPLEAFSCA